MIKRFTTKKVVQEAYITLNYTEFTMLEQLVSKIINKHYTSISTSEEHLLLELIDTVAPVPMPKHVPVEKQQDFKQEAARADINQARKLICKVPPKAGAKPCNSCEFTKCKFHGLGKHDFVTLYGVAQTVLREVACGTHTE